jgi:hypothetical protein
MMSAMAMPALRKQMADGSGKLSEGSPVCPLGTLAHPIPQRQKYQKKISIDTLVIDGCKIPKIDVRSKNLTVPRCDEPENLARRYRNFNISALTDAAINAIGGSVRSCKNPFLAHLEGVGQAICYNR